MTCFDKGMTAITTNLPVILSGLAVGRRGTPVVGMSYYDPFLAAWGSSGIERAEPGRTERDAGLDKLNSLLQGDFGAAAHRRRGRRLRHHGLRPDGPLQGADSVPVNVARICDVDPHVHGAGLPRQRRRPRPHRQGLREDPSCPASPPAGAGGAS